MDLDNFIIDKTKEMSRSSKRGEEKREERSAHYLNQNRSNCCCQTREKRGE